MPAAAVAGGSSGSSSRTGKEKNEAYAGARATATISTTAVAGQVASVPHSGSLHSTSSMAWAIRGLVRGGWAPAGLFLLHVILVKASSLYATHDWLDIPMHLMGGIAIAFFFLVCWREAVAHGVAGRPAAGLAPLVTALGTCAAAILWEFAEFVSDRFLGTRVQTTVEDTLADLALGLVGGLIVAWASWPRRAGKAEPLPMTAMGRDIGPREGATESRRGGPR